MNGITGELSSTIPERHYIPLLTVLPIIQNCEKEFEGTAMHSKHAHDAVKLTIEHWEIDQLCYFHGAYQKNAVRAEVYKGLSLKLFVWGVGAMIALAFLQGYNNGFNFHPQPGFWKPADYLLTLGPTMIVLAAITEFYGGRRGFEVDSGRYKNAHHIFLRNNLTDPRPSEEIKSEKRVEGVTKKAFLVSDTLAGLALLAMAFAVKSGIMSRLPEGEPPYLNSYILGAVVLMILSITVDLLVNRFAPEIERKRDEATRVKWIAGAKSRHTSNSATYRKHVEAVSREALDELIDWYISSLDREVAIPKG